MTGSMFTALPGGQIALNTSSGGGITQAQLDAVAAACGPSQRPFSAALVFAGSPVVYAPQPIAEATTFSIAPSPQQGASAILQLLSNGTTIPAFPAPQFRELTGSAGWQSSAGAINLVHLIYLDTTAYYSISQVLPTPFVPPAVDPTIESFVLFSRRTPDVTLAGNIYSGIATSAWSTTYAKSNVRLIGDGYFVTAPPLGATELMLGLSESGAQPDQYFNWKYNLVRYGPAGGCIFRHDNTVQGDFPTVADAEIRFARTGNVVKIQTKTPAQAAWVDRHTYTQTSASNLWLNFSVGAANAGVTGTCVNPRSLGAT